MPSVRLSPTSGTAEALVLPRQAVRTMVHAADRPLGPLRRSRFLRHLRPSDVFLVGHPKSGNTLVAYSLALASNSDAMDEVTLRNVGRFVPTVHGAEWRVRRFGSLASPRTFRNEWPVFPELYPKTVYLVRDPRSVLVSYFHHYRAVMPGAQPDLHQFVQRYLESGCIAEFEPRLERWDRHVSGWIERGRHQDVLLVRFEDLVADRRATLERIFDYTERSVGTKLDEIVARSALDEMQRMEDRHGAESFPGGAAMGERFVRSGSVDAWRSELSDADLSSIDGTFGSVMSHLGYRPGRDGSGGLSPHLLAPASPSSTSR